MDSIKKPPHETLGTPCPQITPNAHSYTENSSCLTHTHTTLWLASCVCSSMAVRANFGRWLVSIHRKPDGICRPKRNHKLALSHRLWESKREALASGLVCCRIKKKGCKCKNSTTRGSRKCGAYSQKVGKSFKICSKAKSLAKLMESILSQSHSVMTEGGV